MKQGIVTLSFFSILLFIFPLVVLADDKEIENDYEEIAEVISSDITKIPEINARHAVILDRCSKKVIYGKKETEKCKMASTTKIMTAIIVIENCALDDIVTVSEKSAGTGGSTIHLSKNDKITVHDLLYGLMLKSGNDAAVALAEHAGSSIEGFANLMNKKANELGLKSTHFSTPHGLDNKDHYTSAYDLAILADYALKNEIFSNIVKTKSYTITINGYPRSLTNTNELLGNFEGIYGVKTGFTNGANRCLVTSCKRGDLDIICVVLGCDTKKYRTQDSIKLLNYVFSNYTVINVKDIIINKFSEWKNENKNSFVINKGSCQCLDFYLDNNDFDFFQIAINKSSINNVNVSIKYDNIFEAPLSNSSKIGAISLYIGTNEYFSVDILNSNSINRKNCLDYIFFIFKNYCSFFK